MTILVTAPTGKVGRHVADQLVTRGIGVRTGSRRSPIPLDWTDSATWPAALDGIEKLFLIVPGGDDEHRSVAGLGPQVCDFIDLAVAHGVSRVVLMTALGMDFAPAEVEQRAVELHLQYSGLGWSILRPNWFFQNLTEGPLRVLANAHDGVLRVPAGDAATSFIDTRDIAAVAVEALLGEPVEREYALTGPEGLTFAQFVSACRDATIPIREYRSISEAEFREDALTLGWHTDYVDILSGLFASIAAGYAAEVTDDVIRATGRQPRTLSEFLRERE